MTTLTDRDEWLEWRRGGIGASDVAGLLGLSKWSSPFTIWCDKLGLSPPSEDSERMRMGRRMEPVLRDEFMDRTHLYVAGEQSAVTSEEHPWARATLDGWVTETPDAARDEYAGPWEAKTFDVTDPTGNLTLPVRAQVIWQCAVTETSQAWVTGITRFWRVQHVHFLMDDDARDDLIYMREVASRFWHENVLGQVQPAVDGSDATSKMLAYLYPEQDPGTRADLDKLADVIARHADVKARLAEMKALEAERSELENRIRDAIEDAELGCLDGEPVYSLRAQHRPEHTVAASTFRVLRPATKKDKDQ
jgi:putative phage-type endonuclease